MTSAATTLHPNPPTDRPARRRTRATSPVRPRLTAVPDCEPPFDDERTGTDRISGLRRQPAAGKTRPRRRSEPTTRTRSADLQSGSVATAPRPSGAALSGLATAVAVTSRTVPDLSRAEDIGVQRTPTAQLPPVRQTGTGYARALTEVLTGVRPAQQLRAHCTPPVFVGLDERSPLPGTGLARLHSAHVAEPVDGVAEVSAVFRRGPRLRAIAFRLEGMDGRWRITALQVG